MMEIWVKVRCSEVWSEGSYSKCELLVLIDFVFRKRQNRNCVNTARYSRDIQNIAQNTASMFFISYERWWPRINRKLAWKIRFMKVDKDPQSFWSIVGVTSICVRVDSGEDLGISVGGILSWGRTSFCCSSILQSGYRNRRCMIFSCDRHYPICIRANVLECTDRTVVCR